MATSTSSTIVRDYTAAQLDAFLGPEAAAAMQSFEDHLISGAPITSPTGELHYWAERHLPLRADIAAIVQSGTKDIHVFTYGQLVLVASGAMHMMISENDKRRLFFYVTEAVGMAEATAVGNYLELLATDGKLTDDQPKPTLLVSDGSGIGGLGGNLAIGNSLASELMKRDNFVAQIVFFRDENTARDSLLKMFFNLLRMKLKSVGSLDNAVVEARALGF